MKWTIFSKKKSSSCTPLVYLYHTQRGLASIVHQPACLSEFYLEQRLCVLCTAHCVLLVFKDQSRCISIILEVFVSLLYTKDCVSILKGSFTIGKNYQVRSLCLVSCVFVLVWHHLRFKQCEKILHILMANTATSYDGSI